MFSAERAVGGSVKGIALDSVVTRPIRPETAHRRLARSPPTRTPTARALCKATSAATITPVACSASAAPAGVSETDRECRRNSADPMDRSRRRIRRLSAGWDRYSRAAARVILCSSATTSMHCKSVRSTRSHHTCGSRNDSGLGNPFTTPHYLVVKQRISSDRPTRPKDSEPTVAPLGWVAQRSPVLVFRATLY
jgi:hypothetical protein